MLLYLIRHAHAEDTAPDSLRRLSKRGRQQVRAIGGFLRRGEGFSPEEVWHSPLVRAQETADLLRKITKSPALLREVDHLCPADNPQEIARKLTSGESALALVGHEPHLSALASLLVTGTASPVRFVMKKCAVLALERVERRWVVRWHITPDLLG